MNEEQMEDFKLWAEQQPGYLSYTRVVNFLKDLLDVSKSDAEVEIARMQRDGEVRVISLSNNSGRRVFLEPIEELDESHVRAVWDGSPQVGQTLDRILKGVKDRTGHDIEDIREFLKQLDSAEVTEEKFTWKYV